MSPRPYSRAGRILMILNAVGLTGFGIVLLLIAQGYGGPLLPPLAFLLIGCAALAVFPATAVIGAVALSLVAVGAVVIGVWRDLVNAGDMLPFLIPAAAQWLAVSLREGPVAPTDQS